MKINGMETGGVLHDKTGIINAFIRIEDRINSVISNFFACKESSLFESIILNSSILGFGQKIKVIKNIPGCDDKQLFNNLRRISSIRNAFAHVKIISTINLTTEPSENLRELNVMNSEGKIMSKILSVEIDDFYTAASYIHNYLNDHFPHSKDSSD